MKFKQLMFNERWILFKFKVKYKMKNPLDKLEKA